ncbi:MAG: translation initiation factor [Chthoniobacteraceae bacterium]
MAKKERIPISGPQSGLNAAFAGLDLGGLSEGPAEVVPSAPSRPTKLGRVVLRKETAHRGGRVVIVVHDFGPSITDDFVEELARELRAVCGCGGTVKDRQIEIQGDQAGKIRAYLLSKGFQVAGVK